MELSTFWEVKCEETKKELEETLDETGFEGRVGGWLVLGLPP